MDLAPRAQGDIGELSAMHWLAGIGARIAIPLGHSPDWDLIAELDGELFRIQVKTSTFHRNGRWEVMVCTRGGNQSWNGRTKLLDRARCDYLFVLVGDGRRWFIPSESVGGQSGIRLGGPKYAEFEVASDRPLGQRQTPPKVISRITPDLSRGDARVVKGTAL